jgi:allophanate hydrolase subunit 2
MPAGGVQVTPAGQPVVLLAGRGTVGGYPLLATATTVGLWRMGQVRPGDQVRFHQVTVREAGDQTRELRRQLQSLAPRLVRVTAVIGAEG